jgi:hypothetical protein
MGTAPSVPAGALTECNVSHALVASLSHSGMLHRRRVFKKTLLSDNAT